VAYSYFISFVATNEEEDDDGRERWPGLLTSSITGRLFLFFILAA